MSQIYSVFQSVASISLGCVKSKGEDDFGKWIPGEIWESSIEIMHTVSILAKIKFDLNLAYGLVCETLFMMSRP